MIIDIHRFLSAGRPFWRELEEQLERLERDPGLRFDLETASRFHYLYERAAADLTRLSTFAAEPDLQLYLEQLVARAYGEIHESRRRLRVRLRPWFAETFPRAVRRHATALRVALAVFLGGALFGALALVFDPPAKSVIIPSAFDHLRQDPERRVAQEESDREGGTGAESSFSAYLMQNNIRVSITVLALGITWGLGTVVLLFYNGVLLGAIVMDYLRAGQGMFLAGWLLPHGVVEIPAILIASQAGLVIAHTLLGRGSSQPLSARFRAAGPDIATLIGGVAAMLVWAGLVEAFLSQVHEPALPYAAKIAFGVVEALLLGLYLARAGKVRGEAGP